MRISSEFFFSFSFIIMIAMTFDDDAKPDDLMVKFHSSLPEVKGLNNRINLNGQGMKIPKEEVLVDKELEDLAFGMEYSPDHLKEFKKTLDNRVLADNIRTTLSKKEIDEQLTAIENELNEFRSRNDAVNEQTIESQKSNGTDLKNNSLNRMLEKMRRQSSNRQSQIDMNSGSSNSKNDNMSFSSNQTMPESSNQLMNNSEDALLDTLYREAGYNKSIQTLLGEQPDYEKVKQIEEENKKWKLKTNEVIEQAPLFQSIESNSSETAPLFQSIESNSSETAPLFQSIESNSSDADRPYSQGQNIMNASDSFPIALENSLVSQDFDETDGSKEIKFPKRYQSNKISKENSNSIVRPVEPQARIQNFNTFSNLNIKSTPPKEKRAPVNKIMNQKASNPQDVSSNPVSRIPDPINNVPASVSVKIPSRLAIEKNPMKRMNVPLNSNPIPNLNQPYVSSTYSESPFNEGKAYLGYDSQPLDFPYGTDEYNEPYIETSSTMIPNDNYNPTAIPFNNEAQLYVAPSGMQTQYNYSQYQNQFRNSQNPESYVQTNSTNPQLPILPSMNRMDSRASYSQIYNLNTFIDPNGHPFSPNDYYAGCELQQPNNPYNGCFPDTNSEIKSNEEAMNGINADQEFNESDLNYLISKDAVKRKLLLMLSDGSWHSEYELIRNLKKERTMGFISFGVMVESINEEVHSMFINVGKSENQTNQYRINPAHLSILKKSLAAYDYT